MELNHLIDLISQLPQNSKLKYVRGNNTCTFVSVDKQENRVYAKTPEGKDFSFAPSFLGELSQRIEPNVPFSTSQLLNNKGTNRAVIDSIIANTAEFYWINGDNRSKFTVWIPSSPHEIGKLVEWKDMNVLDTSSKVNSVSISLSTILFDDANKKHYTQEELIPILSQMYKDGEDDKLKSANLILFGLKYGESIANATQLCAAANIPLSTPVVDGVKLHKLIKMRKYGVGFFDENMNIHKNVMETHKQSSPLLPLQIIYYGAPGTGKSHTIKEETRGKDKIRTTFHPDSDYSTFVGAYKPTMGDKERYADSGLLVKYQEDKDTHKKGDAIKEKEIVYEFVPQAFLKAYVGAWQKYCENQEEPSPQYLVIEEINRGNCAQIFGDLFQLLDRNGQGFSEYPINADSDISKYISETFNKLGLSIADHRVVNDMYNDDDEDDDVDVAQKVLDGEILLLPNNLFIWATMNTSDQSLFPIDSAFKRRWDWKYVPITEAILRDEKGNVVKGADGKPEHLDWVIKIGKREYDWWSFLQKVNSDVVYALTSSEDKKLGYFFCKAKSGVISAETFTDKVIFYLWNEVFKDSATDGLECLKNEDDKEHPKLTFQLFYTEDENGRTIVNEKSLNTFLTNLGVTIVKDSTSSEKAGDASEDDGEPTENNGQ